MSELVDRIQHFMDNCTLQPQDRGLFFINLVVSSPETPTPEDVETIVEMGQQDPGESSITMWLPSSLAIRPRPDWCREMLRIDAEHFMDRVWLRANPKEMKALAKLLDPVSQARIIVGSRSVFALGGKEKRFAHSVIEFILDYQMKRVNEISDDEKAQVWEQIDQALPWLEDKVPQAMEMKRALLQTHAAEPPRQCVNTKPKM